VARDTGALVRLQFALQFLSSSHLLAGDLAAAARAIEEDRAIAEATGTSPVAYTEMTLAAWRGQEALTSKLIERERRQAKQRGIGRMDHFATYAASVLYNGIARYDAAHDAARRAFEHDHLGYTPFVVPEVAEAASRTGDTALLQATLEWMSERTSAMPTDWALGIDARVRALASEGDEAERFYRESIERLARTRLRVELARARLLYGEWLRREGRRVDAREQLRVAREMLLSMGAEGFAERARRELLATGEKVRKRRDDTRDELTPQEEHIARLARDGRTNPEIGAELFLSPRTVEWHLKKVFTKLGISSRRALRDALPREAAAV
jgi:DNA-binding CsgD family transcriptional regulator